MATSFQSRGSRWTIAWLSFALAASAGVDARAADDEAPTYERDVKPLFARRCNVCHSKKNLGKADVSAGLALDSYEAAMAGTGEHAVIEAGKAISSELFRRLDDPDEERRMPLAEEPLDESQRTLVRRWIDAGAPRGVAARSTPATPATQAGSRHLARRVVRTLDVVIPTEAKAPTGLEGIGAGGPVHLSIKVGPLPPVTALAFRGDGRQLAVGTYGAVVVWDLDSARPALVLDDVPGQVHALAYQRDGRWLAVGAGLPARSGSVRIYELSDGSASLIDDLPGHDDAVFGLAFSPDGRRLATASFDQTVRLWDLDRGPGKDKLEGVFRGHSDFVYDVAFAADGASLLSASKDRSVKRIDVATLKERRTYSDHNEDVLALAIQPGGSKFVTAGNEPQVRWWGLDDEKPAMKVAGHAGPVHQLSFSRDGRRLVSAGGDGSVRLWDGATGALLRSLPVPGAAEWQYAAVLSDDGKRAAAGGWDGLVRLWDADTPRLLATLVQPPAATADGDAYEWLVAVPSGFTAASGPLLPLLRWQVAGKEVAGDVAPSLLVKPGEVARSLRGGQAVDPFADVQKSGKTN